MKNLILDALERAGRTELTDAQIANARLNGDILSGLSRTDRYGEGLPPAAYMANEGFKNDHFTAQLASLMADPVRKNLAIKQRFLPPNIDEIMAKGERIPNAWFHGTRQLFSEFDPQRVDTGMHAGTMSAAYDRLKQTSSPLNAGQPQRVMPLLTNVTEDSGLRMPDVGRWNYPDEVLQAMMRKPEFQNDHWESLWLDAASARTDALAGGMDPDEFIALEAPDFQEQIRDGLMDEGYDHIRYINQHEGQSMLTPAAKQAEAELAAREYDLLRQGKDFEADALWDNHDDPWGDINQQTGGDSIIFLDESTIRSPMAAFDPAKSTSGNMMGAINPTLLAAMGAGSGAAALLGPELAEQYRQSEADVYSTLGRGAARMTEGLGRDIAGWVNGLFTGDQSQVDAIQDPRAVEPGPMADEWSQAAGEAVQGALGAQVTDDYTLGDVLGNTVKSIQGAIPEPVVSLWDSLSDENKVRAMSGAGLASMIGAPARPRLNVVGGMDPLPDAPSQPNIPTIGPVNIGRNKGAVQAAQDYAARTGIPYDQVDEYVRVDPDRAARIATEYDVMQHSPADPEVNRAYQALADETLDQYDNMLVQGIEPFFINGVDPYRNSPYEALIDVADNNRLGVFPTRDGFGTSDFDPEGNPLLAASGFQIAGEDALVNDIFRAVHDYYGHAKQGAGFRAMGEENAYQAHAGMFSPLARRALASETRGQNSWLNYGPHGEANRTAGIDDTVFADQKSGLMPAWAAEEGRVGALPDRRRASFQARVDSGFFDGALDQNGRVILTHASRTPGLERLDPSKQGGDGVKLGSAEYNRIMDPNAPSRTYYGINATQSPYRESHIIQRPNQYQATIDGSLLYDAQMDPERIFLPGGTMGEKALKDLNYSGYYMDHPQLGKVAVVFDEMPVQVPLRR